MKKPIALVDLDGTLADFDGAMRRDIEALRSPGEPPFEDEGYNEPGYLKARRDMIKRQPDWWFNLEYMESGKWIMDQLQQIGFKIHLLSRAPRKNPPAWEQKVRWAQKHLPGVEITLAPDKGMVYGKVLIDDWPSYIDAWVAHRPRGLVIMPDRSWNHGYRTNNVSPDQTGVLRHCYPENNAVIQNALLLAYERAKKSPASVE